MTSSHTTEYTNDLDEPILSSKTRYSLFPLEYPDIFAFAKKAVACFWTVEEVKLTDDAAHLQRLTPSEHKMLLRVLAFFAGADGLVLDNINMNVINQVTIPEATYFFGFQTAMESIHGEMYSILIDTYVTQESERAELFNAISEIPSVRAKAEWCARWIMTEDAVFAQRLFAFACVEAIFFSASFAIIFWFRSKNILPGLAAANDLISRDEGMHVEFAAMLFSKLKRKPSESIMQNIVREAVHAETVFVRDTIDDTQLVGMTQEKMIQHVQSIADYLLKLFGYPPIYGTHTPFAFMKLQQLETKENFFEVAPVTYRRFEKPCEFEVLDTF